MGITSGSMLPIPFSSGVDSYEIETGANTTSVYIQTNNAAWTSYTGKIFLIYAK